MTLGVFIGTIACAIVAVGATIGCLVFVYKSGDDNSNVEGAIYCGAVAAAAIFGAFALTHNIVWTFII